ncbi:S-layer homology domain-containing protein [Moorella sulfitireducens]|uniref:S-layer homology domain-containing protein n=1 Tax=Neomoorella sulfitireducens TaxID=2972948 RepID=UPI0021AC2341|nr:S-layer homology domain-containing protein [Moorella sulfitireducens]
MFFRFNRRLISLMLAVCFLFSVFMPSVIPEKAIAADQSTTYTVQELKDKAVEFIYQSYKDGEDIDGYTAYLLTLAGEDLGGVKWSTENGTLKKNIEELADLLGDENSLVSYIVANQNDDGTFGPMANEYGTKAPLQALALVKDDYSGDELYEQIEDSIAKAVNYFKERYCEGELTYEVNGWYFDYRCVEALVDAGEDLSAGDWSYNGTTLKDVVLASAEAAAADPSVLDAVYLAKELTALRAVDASSAYIDTLAQAIISKQNKDGSFGGSIYDAVMVLTALGKAGRLDGIDQESALNYLNSFKHKHNDAWGQPAGAAWGGYFEEEPDLTAQVLTALSYFDSAEDQGSDVYNAIQEGLTYLQDIQDVDTGAIPAQWDSTFATAETLIALKSLGKTHADYAGDSSPWVKRSRTKTIAQCLLALSSWGDATRVEKLAEILIGRHSDSGFDDSVYSDMWAYIALGESGRISAIEEEARDYILSKQCAGGDDCGAWGETYGENFNPDFMSTAQAIRALTYLTGYEKDAEIQAAIDSGLQYLQKWLHADGSVYYFDDYWSEDPVVDTAEVIITLKRLGQDPLNWQSEEGLTPVSYMMLNALNEDGSFGAYGNILDAGEALYTYLILIGTIDPGDLLGLVVQPAAATLKVGEQQQFKALMTYFGGTRIDVTGEADWSVENGNVASVSSGLVTALNKGQTVVKAVYNGLAATATLNITESATSSSQETNYLEVYIAIVGSNGELLYGPSVVTVSKDNPWGLTVMGALDATGIDYTFAGYVTSIAGLANSGMNGWMYKVNGSVPSVGADQKTIKSGDEIIWWYSTDWTSSGPTWDSLTEASTVSGQQEATPATLTEQNEKLPGTLQASSSALEALQTIDQLLGLEEGTAEVGALSNAGRAVVVVGGDSALSRAEMAGLKKALAQNTVDLAVEVTAESGAVIADEQEEIALAVPAGALAKDTKITIKESAFNDSGLTLPSGYRPVTGVFDFGPDGTTFKVPVTIILKFALPPLVQAENLALAWYDKEKGEWVAVPAVADLSRGLIVAQVNHFTNFAVFAREARLSFVDVTSDSYGWAKNTIEELAGAGIVAGIDGRHFEPGRAVTRAEFASLLTKALDLENSEATQVPFTDVKSGDRYAGAVAAAYAGGLIRGYEDGTFRPQKSITREEMAAMLARALDLLDYEGDVSFKDSDKISAWAMNSVAAAAARGLVKGYEDGTFRPAATASRAECAVMIYRMLTAE